MGDFSDEDYYGGGREEEWNYKDELLASCSYLGKKIEGNKYDKGADCIESLKEIQQFLYRDDPVGEIDQPSRFDTNGRPISKRPWELHRSLADWNILSNHILPLVACHGNDPEVLYESMVVMLLMTSLPPAPKYLLDDEKETKMMKQKVYGAALVPVFDGLIMMKEQFASNKAVLLTIMKWLSEPLMHEGEDRTEAEATVLELALNLIRNLLVNECPVDSGVKLPESTRKELSHAQDKLLDTFAEVGVLEMVIILAQRIEDEENRTWNLLLLDIFSLIFVKEDAGEVSGSGAVVSGQWQASARRMELLARLPGAAEEAQRRGRTGRRHQRFTGVFQTTSHNGIKLLNGAINPTSSVPHTNAKKRAAGFKKKPLMEASKVSVVDRSPVLQKLDRAAALFLQVGFNALFGTVSFDYAMESNAIVKADDWNYSSLAAWCLRYHRLREHARIKALPPKPKPPPPHHTDKAASDKAPQHPAHPDKEQPEADKQHAKESERAAAEEGAAASEQPAASAAAREEAAAAAGAEAEGEAGKEGAAGEGAKGGGAEEEEEEGAAREEQPSAATAPEERVEEEGGSAEAGEAEEGGGVSGEVRGVVAELCARVAALHPAPDPSSDQPLQDAAAAEARQPATPPPPEEKEEEKEEEEEAVDEYDFSAGEVSSLIDLGSLKWAVEKTFRMVKPEVGGGRPQWAHLPPLIALLKEMVLALERLYQGASVRHRDAASVILRNLIFEWDCGEIFLTLLKEFRPDRNTRGYLADLAGLVHTALRLIKAFSQDNSNLLRLKRRKRKVRRGKARVNKEEGDGEWLGGEEEEEEYEESYEEVAFHLDSFQRRFCHPQVVTTYVYLLSWYKSNGQETNHEAVKMLNLIAHSCQMLPLLFQMSVFRVFTVILNDKGVEGKSEYKELVDFVRWVTRHYFRLALESPCMFVELVSWTKSRRDCELVMRGFKPEERAGKPDKTTTEEEAVYLLGKQAGKWSGDDDLLLTEAFHQFSDRPNAPQIVAAMLDAKTPQQVAARWAKLGLSRLNFAWDDDDDDEEEGGADVYTWARRVRHTRPAALDWVVAQVAGAEEEAAVVGAEEARGSALPAAFVQLQPVALVPLEGEEWDHLLDPTTMRLLAALGLSAPRLVQGQAYWTVGAELLSERGGLAKKVADLRLAQAVPVADKPPAPNAPPNHLSNHHPDTAETGAGSPGGGSPGGGSPESSQATREKKKKVRRVRRSSDLDSGADSPQAKPSSTGYNLNDDDDDSADDETGRRPEAPDEDGARQSEEEEEEQQVVRRKAKRVLLDDDDDDDPSPSGLEVRAGEEGERGIEVKAGAAATKRARLRLLADSDEE